MTIDGFRLLIIEIYKIIAYHTPYSRIATLNHRQSKPQPRIIALLSTDRVQNQGQILLAPLLLHHWSENFKFRHVDVMRLAILPVGRVPTSLRPVYHGSQLWVCPLSDENVAGDKVVVREHDRARCRSLTSDFDTPGVLELLHGFWAFEWALPVAEPRTIVEEYVADWLLIYASC